MPSATLYEVLESDRSATVDDLRKQYRRLIIACHPDKCPEHERARANEKAKLVNAAWQVLRDAEKRAEYDRLLGLRAPRRSETDGSGTAEARRQAPERSDGSHASGTGPRRRRQPEPATKDEWERRQAARWREQGARRQEEAAARMKAELAERLRREAHRREAPAARAQGQAAQPGSAPPPNMDALGLGLIRFQASREARAGRRRPLHPAVVSGRQHFQNGRWREALICWERAAAEGDSLSAYNCGLLLAAAPPGIVRDLKRSRMHLSRAASLGIDGAREILAAVEAALRRA